METQEAWVSCKSSCFVFSLRNESRLNTQIKLNGLNDVIETVSVLVINDSEVNNTQFPVITNLIGFLPYGF